MWGWNLDQSPQWKVLPKPKIHPPLRCQKRNQMHWEGTEMVGIRRSKRNICFSYGHRDTKPRTSRYTEYWVSLLPALHSGKVALPLLTLDYWTQGRRMCSFTNSPSLPVTRRNSSFSRDSSRWEAALSRVLIHKLMFPWKNVNASSCLAGLSATHQQWPGLRDPASTLPLE